MKDFPALAPRRCGGPTDGTRLGEEGCDARYQLLVEHERRVPLSPSQPDVGDFEAGRPGQGRLGTARRMTQPFAVSWSSPTSRVSPWAMVFVARKPNCPAVLQQRCGPQEEVGAKVGVPLLPSASDQRGNPGSQRPKVACDLLPAHERRIADECIEPAPIQQHFGELQRPVEGRLSVHDFLGRCPEIF